MTFALTAGKTFQNDRRQIVGKGVVCDSSQQPIKEKDNPMPFVTGGKKLARRRNVLQGLGQWTARRLQPRLASQRGCLGKTRCYFSANTARIGVMRYAQEAADCLPAKNSMSVQIGSLPRPP